MTTGRPLLPVLGAAAADIVCILTFVAIGRSAHTDGVTPAGMVTTAWPFVVGAALGWSASRAWRRPVAVVPSGIAIWLCCVGGGMVLRVVAGQGTAAAFVVVALCFLGLGLIGWRLAWHIVAGHRRPAGVGRTDDTDDVMTDVGTGGAGPSPPR